VLRGSVVDKYHGAGNRATEIRFVQIEQHHIMIIAITR